MHRYPIALLALEATQAKYWVALYFHILNIFTRTFPLSTGKKNFMKIHVCILAIR